MRASGETTRPNGSGVILAADMEGHAHGRFVAAVLAIMGQAQDREAAVLAPVAHAMTDVTGFGLAGHVKAICEASGWMRNCGRRPFQFMRGRRRCRMRE